MDWLIWRQLTVGEIVGLAAGLVALIGLALALATPEGRAAFARLGLRVADALVAWLEHWLSPAERMMRRARHDHD